MIAYKHFTRMLREHMCYYIWRIKEIAYKHNTRMLREYDSLQALYKNVKRI
jgi:hypothetical protein